MTPPRLPSLVLATALLVGCGGGDGLGLDDLDTPRSQLPSALAGDWFTGTLSTIQYYDRDTGAWQDPSGSGFYYVFDADGAYETGAVIDSTVGGCTMRLLGNETGTLTLDGPALTLYRHQITVHVTNTCGNDGDRVQGEATRFLSWSVDRDADGVEWLALTHDDGSVERYHRWD